MTLDIALRDFHNDRIQLSPPQIELIAAAIRSRAPGCRLLVFGLGNDTAMWRAINRDGYTLFVEDSQPWIEKCKALSPGLEVLHVSYGDRTVASSLPLDRASLEAYPVPEPLADTPWDVILVDAPTGYDDACPGRSLSIWWASRLMSSHTHVFVDDHQRTLESEYTAELIEKKASSSVTLRRAGGELYWAIGQSAGFQGFQGVDHAGNRRRIRYLVATEQLRVLLFHDSVDALPSMIERGLLDSKSIVYFSFSWFRSEAAVRHVRQVLFAAQERHKLDLTKQVFVLVNSSTELQAFRTLLPEFEALLVNNSALLDPSLFRIESGERNHEAVLNAKALAFKRHELSADIPGKLFISYTVQEPDEGRTKGVNLSSFAPKTIVRDIPAKELSRNLGTADVGLALSEEEGACYASLEYLLCGLPVVSTPSRGGRDEFYDSENSIVAEPDPGAIQRAVAQARAKLASGEFSRERIRHNALKRRSEFLETWYAHLQPHLERAGITTSAKLVIEDAIFAGSKLIKHKNFWIKEICS